MVGAEAGTGLRTTPTGGVLFENACLLHRVSSEDRNWEGHESTESLTLPSGLCRFRRSGARSARASCNEIRLRSRFLRPARSYSAMRPPNSRSHSRQ